MFRLMAESTKAIPFTLDLTRNCFTYIGAQGVADSDIPESQWKEPGALDIVVPRKTNHEIRRRSDESQKKMADLNQAIRSALVIANYEYKFVAEIDTQFADLRRSNATWARSIKWSSTCW
jgi:hypothetical protein